MGRGGIPSCSAGSSRIAQPQASCHQGAGVCTHGKQPISLATSMHSVFEMWFALSFHVFQTASCKSERVAMAWLRWSMLSRTDGQVMPFCEAAHLESIGNVLGNMTGSLEVLASPWSHTFFPQDEYEPDQRGDIAPSRLLLHSSVFATNSCASPAHAHPHEFLT